MNEYGPRVLLTRCFFFHVK